MSRHEVLLEQWCWFEDEVKFVRRLLEPGRQEIDVGANDGVYTFSMAKAVGATGKLWAFEPASTKADFRAASIVENDFRQVARERRTRPNIVGTASLSLHADSKLSVLVLGAGASGAHEMVSLVTRDERAAFHGCWDVDFIRIKTEREALNILGGGRGHFFAPNSPATRRWCSAK